MKRKLFPPKLRETKMREREGCSAQKFEIELPEVCAFDCTPELKFLCFCSTGALFLSPPTTTSVKFDCRLNYSTKVVLQAFFCSCYKKGSLTKREGNLCHKGLEFSTVEVQNVN